MVKKYFLYFVAVIGVVSFVACEKGAAAELPDLEITEVQVTLGRTPGEDFVYYEYLTVVKVKNKGVAVKSYDVYLNAGEDQENKKVLNKDDSFALGRYEEIEIPYQILKSDQNPRVFRFQIDSGDDAVSQQQGGIVEESDEKNNFYDLQII